MQISDHSADAHSIRRDVGALVHHQADDQRAVSRAMALTFLHLTPPWETREIRVRLISCT